MPNGFSPTAPVTFLDARAVVGRLRAVAQALCARDPNVVAVVLFGSLAHGIPTPASDADLLVVLRSDARRVLDRIPDWTRPFETPGLAIQMLPWTLDELRRRLAAGQRFAREVIETGIVLGGSLPKDSGPRSDS
jgi:predicted nucleotidyltransferase